MSVKNPVVTPSERLASVDDMLLYRLGQLTSTAGAMVVRLCDGGYGITRREWAVLAQLHGQPQGVLPSALAERMQRDRARTSRALTALQAKGLVERVADGLWALTERGREAARTGCVTTIEREARVVWRGVA